MINPLPRPIAFGTVFLGNAALVLFVVFLARKLGFLGLVLGIFILLLAGYLYFRLTLFLPLTPWGYRSGKWVVPRLYDFLANFLPGHDRDAIEKIIREAGIKTGHRVLDLACGTGFAGLGISALFPGIKVFGLDLSPPMLKRARAKALREGSAMTSFWVNGEVESLPFQDGGFDCTLSIFHMNLTRDRESTLREAVRVTRTGGKVVIQVPRPVLPHMKGERWFRVLMQRSGLEEVRSMTNSACCLLLVGIKR